MSAELHQRTAAVQLDEVEDIDNVIVDMIWNQLDRQVHREQVGNVVAEVALGFQEATVKTFLPIIIQR